MATEIFDIPAVKRYTGIDVIGDVPWGTHFCLFYESGDDLVEILVPYFKAGLENNEFCMWVTAEPLNEKEAEKALRRVVPDLDRFKESGQLLIIPHTQWYLLGGSFDQQRVLNGWVDKLEDALAKGFEGLRLTGNTFWLEEEDWRSFADYEAAVDDVIGDYKMLAIYTYSLEKCGASEIIDVVSNHEFALIKRAGNWELIESAEHAKTHQELDRQLSFRKTVLDTIDALVIVRDRTGRIVSTNRKAYDITHYVSEELNGGLLWDMAPPEEVETLKDLFEDLIAGNYSHRHENHLLTKDGRRRLISWSCSVVLAKGSVASVISTGIDITEPRKNEVELARLASFPLLNPNPIFETDLQGNITFRNPAAERLFSGLAKKGEPENTLLGGLDEVITTLKRTGRESMNREAGLGDSNYLQTIYRVPGTDLLRFYNFDITERKRTEEALRRSEERLNRAQEIAHLGSWELDLVANQLTWSDEVYRIFGLEPQQFSATYEAFLEAIHPEDRQAVDDAYSNSVRDKKPGYEIEHRIVRRGTGEVRIVYEKCDHVRDESGAVTRSVGMVHDITERKRAEAERDKLLEDLNSSNKELEQFAYIASHDLQEPLRMVSSYVQLIARRYNDRLDKDGHEFIDYAVDGAKRMQKMIDDLLSYSRIATRGKPFEAVGTGTALRKAEANLRAAIEEARAEITHDRMPQVEGDGAQIIQLFQNLISNAIKFRGENTPMIRVSAEGKEDGYLFSVRDNGIGIPAEHLEGIFDIFERLHGAEKPGTGIGLAICKRIVERHGGRIWVESEPGKGSTFYFTIRKSSEIG